MPSAYLQWRFHSGERVVARGPLVCDCGTIVRSPRYSTASQHICLEMKYIVVCTVPLNQRTFIVMLHILSTCPQETCDIQDLKIIFARIP